MIRGRVMGGISNPTLFNLEGAKLYLADWPKKTKIVGIRVTHEVVSEVITDFIPCPDDFYPL